MATAFDSNLGVDQQVETRKADKVDLHHDPRSSSWQLALPNK